MVVCLLKTTAFLSLGLKSDFGNNFGFPGETYFDQTTIRIEAGTHFERGRRLWHFNAPAGQHRFELNLTAGAYFVNSSGESQHETIKIIIQ